MIYVYFIVSAGSAGVPRISAGAVACAAIAALVMLGFRAGESTTQI